MNLRIGQGIDSHAFTEGRKLILGGVDIPYPRGLKGHSDADALVHAICDALLGALSLGDIGQHFPDTDPRWCDADSAVFVAHAIELAASDGFRLVNCDLTVIGDRPRIAPHREDLRNSLAKLLGVPSSVVSIKATTTDRLGFVGRGEGLAALAVVLLSEARNE